jgi:carbamoylphosphate synthase small subunit
VIGKGSKRIALVDCGVKWNIVRQLIDLECEVELLPWSTDLSTVDCSGWLLSNGPGDPQNAGGLIDQVKKIMTADRPIFGICLGYQILALAAGAKTEKLKFGHRGHNHSVHLVGTNRGFMTSQNHGYCVIEETLPEGWSPWFKHLNDGTLEGIRHQGLPHRGVQFHPEAAAGPQDTRWLLENFIQEIRS